MAKPMHPTPNLDQLESGPWPSFVTGLKRLAKDKDYMVDILGHLEHSYQTRKGYWKGGTVGVRGYGGGVIPRFTEIKDDTGKPVFKDAAEFHTLRIMPPAGMHYNTATLRQFCDIWEKHGSGLIAFHGQSGDIMFQGAPPRTCRRPSTRSTSMGFDLGGAGPAVRTSMSCVGHARCEQSCYDEAKAHREVLNTFLDDIHRPALPYKFKFKFSGCPNDCMNSIQRSDMAVIGTWRDNIQHRRGAGEEVVRQARHERAGERRRRHAARPSAIQIKEIKAVSQGRHVSSVASTTARRWKSTTRTACAACTASTS
jgi:sulfite reductase alpha subunit